MIRNLIYRLKSYSSSLVRPFAGSDTEFFLNIPDYFTTCWALLLVAALNIAFTLNDIQTNPFEVGTEIIEITPPVGYLRYGYPPKESTGIKDPINAKALVFKQGEIKGAILICDLLGIPRALSRIVRERASKQSGIPYENITIAATHTHTSPSITEEFQKYADRELMGNLTDEDQESYFTYLINGMSKAIVSASKKKQGVEMISGIGTAPGISFNRRYLMTDGRVRFMPGGLSHKIVRPVGPVDADVNFILFRPIDQTAFCASLSAFASHYALGGTEFSADYPFYLQEHLREILDKKIVSIFGAGASGNISTIDFLQADHNRKPSDAEKVGFRLAKAIKKALPDAKNVTPDLAIVSRTIYLPLQDYSEEELQWSKESTEPLYPERAFMEMRRRLKLSVWGVQPPLEKLRQNEAVPPSFAGDVWRLPVEIHAFRLDSRTVVVTMPGELFVELGIDLKKRSPFSNTMLIELANADIAYVPTEQAFREGGYEPLNSRLIPGSGEKMIDVAVQMLIELNESVR